MMWGVDLNMILTTADKKRFWDKIDKNGPITNRKDRCWLWTASTVGGGYGGFHLDGSTIGAHKISYEIHYGCIPKKKLVLHSCDNPPCVRPEHLFCGTQKDNMHDMIKKGRANFVRGQEHGSSKLSYTDVEEIRKIYAGRNISMRSIAIRFRISASQICEIVNGNAWRVR